MLSISIIFSSQSQPGEVRPRKSLPQGTNVANPARRAGGEKDGKRHRFYFSGSVRIAMRVQVNGEIDQVYYRDGAMHYELKVHCS